jgi:hypothetical protein
MKIENDFTLILVGQSETEPTYIECYPVDGVLALQDLDGALLSGHPGNDWQHLCNAHEPPFAIRATRHQARQVKTWLARDRMIAAGKLNGQWRLSWRVREKYLTLEQIAWLEAYAETGFEFTGKLLAVAEIAAGLMQLAQRPVRVQAVKKRKPAGKRMKAKERRRLEREEAWTA